MSRYDSTLRQWQDGVVCKTTPLFAHGDTLYQVKYEDGNTLEMTSLPDDQVIFLSEVQVQLERQWRKKKHDLQVRITQACPLLKSPAECASMLGHTGFKGGAGTTCASPKVQPNIARIRGALCQQASFVFEGVFLSSWHTCALPAILYTPTGRRCAQVAILSATGFPQYTTITDYKPGMGAGGFCMMHVFLKFAAAFTQTIE